MITRTVNVAVCHACGRERLSTGENEAVPGYEGQVHHIPPDGKPYDVSASFFACTKRCLSRAMHARIEAALYAEIDKQSDQLTQRGDTAGGSTVDTPEAMQ